MKQLLLGMCTLLTASTFAQVTLDGEVRPRSEYRHGYGVLAPDDTDAGFATTQRTRFNASYTSDKYKVYVSLQDVRTWGEVGTFDLGANSVNRATVNQAWAELFLDPEKSKSLKFGRQPLSYDDERIFGATEWVQQGRRHDVMLYKYSKGSFKLDAGAAFNQQNGNDLLENNYTLNNYKALQYVWAHKEWDQFKASVLFLNNGNQKRDANNVVIDGDDAIVKYSQTYGTHFHVFPKNPFNIVGNFYYQGGKDQEDREISAYLASLEFNYNVTQAFSAGIGAELISGNDADTKATENNRFNPFYGTNHKFNGLMDFFYVGGRGVTSGINDLYLKFGYKVNDKFSMTLVGHNFTANGDNMVNGKNEREIGTEIDWTFVYKIYPEVTLTGGYSQMFASEGGANIAADGQTYKNLNNWGWLMLSFKPKFLN